MNPNGSVKSKHGIVNVENIYRRAREEAQRLGVDSNFLEYLSTDKMGSPLMPNWMNNVSVKLESIAQAIFNRGITRQMLPGWHAAQVTNVGYSDDLAYHPAVIKDGEVIQEAYMEVRLPRWSKLIPESMRADELPEDLQFQIAYRIPTEGKQSVIVIKVKEFLPEAYGSTIIVPDEWVTQTGSDFDIDSVYGIGYNIAKRTKSGELFKIEYNDKTDEANTKLRYNLYKLNESGTENLTYEEFKTWSIEAQNTTAALENQMVDALKTIMSDDSSIEEHLGRSKYDDLRNAATKINKLIAGRNNIIDNPYNPLSQIENRAKAQEGATLKAFSVNRDTFNSICNVGEAYLSMDDAVTVVYPKNDSYNLSVIEEAYDNVKDDKDSYTVTHNRFANSKNNRNIVGQLVTAYSSQTTAHILDAVKVGSLFNENKFTFGTFKTLIDLGVDYYTAELFLAQPGVSAIVEAYNSLESQVVTSYGNAINVALKNVARQYDVKLADGSSITAYTPIPMVIEALNKVSDVKIPTNAKEAIKYKIVLNQKGLEIILNLNLI